ncbi:hypothetical protein FB451DRAFT_1227463, partial [Mycena latifolia]
MPTLDLNTYTFSGAGNYAPGGGYRSNMPPVRNLAANSAVSIVPPPRLPVAPLPYSALPPTTACRSTRGMEANTTGECQRRRPNSAERARMHRRCPIPRLKSARCAATNASRVAVFVSDGGVVVECRLQSSLFIYTLYVLRFEAPNTKNLFDLRRKWGYWAARNV